MVWAGRSDGGALSASASWWAALPLGQPGSAFLDLRLLLLATATLGQDRRVQQGKMTPGDEEGDGEVAEDPLEAISWRTTHVCFPFSRRACG
ncbi:hypothetical protein PLESTM_001292600 [Pleodorina starrii]|nr:hypothetical protein PLESTM_001292600 [Pleodorina starrii]